MKRIKDFPLYDSNPWTAEGIVERLKFQEDEEQIFYNSNGDAFTLKPALKSNGAFMKDYFSYLKIYTANLDKIKKLNSAGLKLFCYILSILKEDAGIVRIDIEKACNFCDYSSMSQYYSGLTNLLYHEFIVKKSDDRMLYFININIFFNGDRVKMLTNT